DYTTDARSDEARRLYLSEPARHERGEVMFFHYMRLALNLAAGDRAAVRADAQQIAELVKEAPGVWSEIYLIDRTVEAFIRVGDPAGAQQFLSTALTAGFESNPLLWR